MGSNLASEISGDLATIEGAAEAALGAGLVVLTALGNMNVAHGALYLTILSAVRSARVTIQRLQTSKATQTAQGVVESALAEIDQIKVAASAVQSAPGTPAEQVKSGLAPTAVEKKA